MSTGYIISCVIYLVTAFIMMGIGLSNLRSKMPVAFYSGEKPPREEELTDVSAWNRKHGMMWIFYGVVIIISWGIGFIVGDSVWCLLPMCGGVILPVMVMVWYHHFLIRRYKKTG